MKLVIRTQFYENYGAHAWDGEGECPQYWKPKGGSTYVVPGLNWMYAAAGTYKGLVERVTNLVSYSNEYAEEYVIDWSFEEDDVKVFEKWENEVYLSESVPHVFDVVEHVKPTGHSFNWGVESMRREYVEIGMPGNEASKREDFVEYVVHPDFGEVVSSRAMYRKMKRHDLYKRVLEKSKRGTIFSYFSWHDEVMV